MIQNVSCQLFQMVVYLTLNRLMSLLLALHMMIMIESCFFGFRSFAYFCFMCVTP